MSDPIEQAVVNYIDLFGTVPTTAVAPELSAGDHTRTALDQTSDLDSQSADGYRSNAQRTIALADILSGLDTTTVQLIMDNARDNTAVRDQLKVWLTEYQSNKQALKSFLGTPTGQAALAAMAANTLTTATTATRDGSARNHQRADEAAKTAGDYSAADWRKAEEASREPALTQQAAITGPYEPGSGTAPKEFYDAMNAALDANGITDPTARANWVRGYETLVDRESSFDPKALNDWDQNWIDGDPSRGYAQVIGKTFAAYHVPGTSTDITDGTANLSASINYAVGHYGVLPDASNLATQIQQADPNRTAQGY